MVQELYDDDLRVSTQRYECLDEVDAAAADGREEEMHSTQYQYATSEPKAPRHKVLSPEQLAVKTFLGSRRKSSLKNFQQPRNIHMSADRGSRKRSSSRSPPRNSPPRRSPHIRSSPKHGSPNGKHNKSFPTNSPLASSTLREDMGLNHNAITDSPLSVTFRHDREDTHNFSYDQVELEDSCLQERPNSDRRNRSSGSDLSATFVLRNDSQMMHTNNSHDLAGYIRNQSFGCRPGNERRDEEEICPDIEQDQHRERHEMVVTAEVEMDAPRESVRFAMSERSSTVTNTEDGLSLTNVTEFTGDYINSFADNASDFPNKSRWVNKDVFMFQRDHIRPSHVMVTHSANHIDETGDSRKPPVPRKSSLSDLSSQVDYVREAEKRLDMYKQKKRSRDLDEQNSAGVSLEKLPREPIGASYYLDTGEVKEHFVEEEIIVPQKAAPRNTSPFKDVSPKFMKSSPQRSPKSPKRASQSPHRSSPSDFMSNNTLDKSVNHRSNDSEKTNDRKSSPIRTSPHKPSPSPRKRSPPTKTRSYESSPLLHSPNRESRRTLNSNSTHEFENLERQLQEDSLAMHNRKSLSMTNLPASKPHPHLEVQRQKSISCTSSVDGDTRSLINDSARYHFLHDKGMVKISSPSLKLLNGRRHSPHCADIDEESDIVESGSDISGVCLANRFSIPSLSGGKTSSELESKAARSDQNVHTATETASEVMSQLEAEEHQLVAMQNTQFERFLKETDAQHENWDNVLGWMSNRFGDDDSDIGEDQLRQIIQDEPESGSDTRVGRKEMHGASQLALMSPDDDSVYYSFRGQSEELRSLLSPVVKGGQSPGRKGRGNYQQTHVKKEIEDIDGDLTGSLMQTIMYGSVRDVARLLRSDTTISEGEIKEATQWALEHQNFEVTMLLLEDICKLIHGAEEEDCVEVFPAYVEGKRWEPVFVILTREMGKGKWDLFMGFHVYRRGYSSISMEASVIINSRLVKKYKLSTEELKVVKRALDRENMHLKHKKITAINACPCKSKKNGQQLEKGLCIAIHCVIKGFIPFDEEPFPHEIGGLPVDVREGYFRLGVPTPPGLVDIQQQLWDHGLYTSDDNETSDSQRSPRSQRSSRSRSTQQNDDNGGVTRALSDQCSEMSGSVQTLESSEDHTTKEGNVAESGAGGIAMVTEDAATTTGEGVAMVTDEILDKVIVFILVIVSLGLQLV